MTAPVRAARSGRACAAPVALLALLLGGCGLKGPLQLPAPAGNVVIRPAGGAPAQAAPSGPAEPSAPAAPPAEPPAPELPPEPQGTGHD